MRNVRRSRTFKRRTLSREDTHVAVAGLLAGELVSELLLK